MRHAAIHASTAEEEAIENAKGGEIFVPKIPSFKVQTIAKAIAPNAKLQFIGMRAGEKLHEEMITQSDAFYTIDIGKFYVILPNNNCISEYLNYYPGSRKVDPGFSYNSETNTEWITVEHMRELIRKHVDLNFKPFK